MIIAIVIFIFIVTLYLYSTRTFDYWTKKGIKHDPPIPIFGNNASAYLMKKSISQSAEDLYWKYPKERVVGFFRSSTPELLLRDPELVKKVLIADFDHFYKRQVSPITLDLESEPLMKNVFNAEGDLWRLLRQRLTPAFTSGKLKAMFPLIVERAERLHTLVANSQGKEIDARELMARFTTDFIGACGFGIEADSLNSDESPIRKLGMKIFDLNIVDAIKMMLKQISPTLFKRIKLTWRLEDDVLTMLLECQKKGLIVGNSIEKFKSDGTPETVTLEMTDLVIAAQVFVFFAAGFETSSSATSYTLHLLAHNPDKLKKVQEEIDTVLAKHDNKLCYESIKEMKYLEMVFKEGMRILPSAGFFVRECVKRYTFEDLNLTIDPGVKIMISLQAMHMDPRFFEDPEEFRPERFDPDSMDTEKTKYVYLPFGDGPRACIGARLGLMQSLAGLAAVLSKFSVSPAPNTVRHPKIDPTPGVVQTIKAGLPLLFQERKTQL